MQISNERLTMKELVTTITQRSQVTLPAEVRRVLGLKPRDQVAFTIEGSDVRLVPAQFTLESAYGSVEPLSRMCQNSGLSCSVRGNPHRKWGTAS